MRKYGYLIGLLCSTLVAEKVELDHVTLLDTQMASILGRGEWGFSSLIQFKDQKPILYDTGFSKDLVMTNAKRLGIDLSQVEIVILSHHHSDHISGLLNLRESFRNANPKAFKTVYVAQGFFEQRYKKNKKTGLFDKVWSIGKKFNKSGVFYTNPLEFKKAAEALGIEFIEVDKPLKLYDNFYLTGPVNRVFDEKNYPNSNFVSNKEGDKQVDRVHDSMSLGLLTDKGWLLMTGCGHAGIRNISELLITLENKPIHSVIGGLHLMNASDKVIDEAGFAMKQHGLQKLIGAHCTGAYAVSKIAEQADLKRESYSNGAIGTKMDSEFNVVRAHQLSTE